MVKRRWLGMRSQLGQHSLDVGVVGQFLENPTTHRVKADGCFDNVLTCWDLEYLRATLATFRRSGHMATKLRAQCWGVGLSQSIMVFGTFQ